MASGQRDLTSLIQTMSPSLEEGDFVFAKIPKDSPTLPYYMLNLRTSEIKMIFQEAEAWTMILPKSAAVEQGLTYEFPCRQITLNVHSSLGAIGFLAAITTRLARNLKLGVNPVSGFYHDHLFVPTARAEEVMDELRSMTNEVQGLKDGMGKLELNDR
ncbi:hypothetical protein HII31_02237 [Pseudocercospora fuligena]|uniref:DUF2241 domain-containing protein n=1 Tax=Pseudocercospora fuligena TaxID=685502 RepID=A0A8H6RS67_9PEZI|nr:hypothetical protein HII31_02237 [Pseudocercospora fuligena]